jgi:hypothetical protein
MGMAIPVLHGVPGESADIVRREDVGEIFESSNALQLEEAVARLHTEPHRLARYRANGPAAGRKYNRSDLARRMLHILEKLQHQ